MAADNKICSKSFFFFALIFLFCQSSESNCSATYSIVTTRHSLGNWHSDGFTRGAGCHHQRPGRESAWKICLSKWNFSVGAQWTVAEEALFSPRSLWRRLNRKSSCLCSMIRLAPGLSGKPYVNSLCRCPLGDNSHLPKLFPHQGRYVILQRCKADLDPPQRISNT